MSEEQAVKPRGRGRPTAAELRAREKNLEEREKALMELEAEVSAPRVEAEPEPVRSRAKGRRAERRRRGANDLTHRLKLGVGFNLDPDYEYRWINGGLDDQRLHDLTRENEPGADWQSVTKDGEPSDSTGTVLRRAVGVNQANEVEYAYLCRKPREFYEEDHAARQAQNDKRIQAIHRGRDPNAPNKAPDGLGYEQRTTMTGAGARAIKI